MEAGKSAADGIKKVHPDAKISVCPLADGGEGTVEALTAGCGGIFTEVTVTGPLGKPSPAATASSKKAKPRSSKCPVPPGSR